MTKTITGKTIAQCIRDGDIKVGDFVKVDRDVTCHWHEGVQILEITDDQSDGTFKVLRDKDGLCVCDIAQFATDLTITITREGTASEARQTKQTIMNKLTSALKRALNEDLQKQYKAGFIDGGLELTGDGKAALIDLLYEEYSKKLTAKAEEVIAEAEKEE